MSSLTPADYIDAAYELLVEHGPGALTLAALCERVGTTKGSFYHHFPSLPAFHEQLLTHYSVTLLGQAIEHAAAEPDPRRRLAVLRQLGVHLPHELEHRIRAWGASHPPAAAAQQRVDGARMEVLVGTFTELGIDGDRAHVLARIGSAIVAGVQDLERSVDRAGLNDVLTEYQRWIEASIPAVAQAVRSAR